MARPVLDAAQERRVGAGQLDQPLRHLDVLVLVAAADVVDLPGAALAEHELDPRAVVLDVQPVPDLAAVAVERQRLAVERVRDEQRDELLRILVRAVRVRAAGDRGGDAERADVGLDEQVAGGLRRAVRARRPQRVGLARGAARLEVAVDLVGRDLDELLPRLAQVLEQHLGAAELGAAELLGAEDRAVDVRLGREVDDRVAAARRPGDVLRHGDVAVVELDAVGQVGAVPGVGQLVEDDDVLAGAEQPLDEVRADEAGAAGDEDPHAGKVSGGPLAPVGRRAAARPGTTSSTCRAAAWRTGR